MLHNRMKKIKLTIYQKTKVQKLSNPKNEKAEKT
jgi:hypothetical protein